MSTTRSAPPAGRPSRRDAERLGGVVAAGDEVHAGLAGVGHRVLGGLAGQEGVEPQRDRLGEERGRRARDHADAVHDLGPGVPDERLLPEGRARSARAARRTGRPPLSARRSRPAAPWPRRTARRARARAPRRSARCCPPRGGRRAAGGRRPATCRRRTAPSAARFIAGVIGAGMEVPEEPVVAEHQLRARLARRARTARSCAETPVTTLRDLGRARHLEAVGPVVVERGRVEQSSRKAMISVAAPAYPANLTRGGIFKAASRGYSAASGENQETGGRIVGHERRRDRGSEQRRCYGHGSRGRGAGGRRRRLRGALPALLPAHRGVRARLRCATAAARRT